ncbi:MAG: ABC transporter transmembrane domain-containing protein [Egibacteraceae bacterium]
MARGHIRQRANGSFEVFVCAGRDPLTGKERRLTGTALTRKEAERLRTRLLGEVDAGRSRGGGSRAAMAQLIERWLETADHEFTTRHTPQNVAHKMSFDSHDDIRRALFDAFERLAPAYFVRRRSGDVTAAASADVELIELYTAHHLPTRIVANVVPACSAAGLAVLHPALLAALLPFLALLGSVPGWLRARAAAQGAEILDRGGALSADLVDAVQGLREVIAFGAERLQLARIDANARKLGAVRVAHGRRGGVEKAVTDVLVSLGLLAVVGVAALLVDSGALPRSAYPPAVALAVTAFVPLAQVTGVGREMSRVAAAAGRITALLDEPAVVTDTPEAVRAARRARGRHGHAGGRARCRGHPPRPLRPRHLPLRA